MRTNNPAKCLSCLKLFERFIRDNKNGRRLQSNGKKVSIGAIIGYKAAFRLLKQFCIEKGFYLRIRLMNQLQGKEVFCEINYWKNFYRKFSDYLYNDCGHYDNYVGSTFKHLRTFFNYLNKDLALGVGDFHRSFYVFKEEIAIFPLMPEQLNFLIFNNEFEEKLSHRMKEVKDFFVFGCTVALRFSDLIALRPSNIRIESGIYYLCVKSVKTGKESLVKLPPYAIAIVDRYKKLKKRLLPKFNLTNANIFIKRLLEQAGLTHPVYVTRKRRGISIERQRINDGALQLFRFCDVATTHTMRRTAITTMLSLGVPEQVVRKISGHSPSGKEFYRYVFWAQTYQDDETEKMFEKLKQKKLEIEVVAYE